MFLCTRSSALQLRLKRQRPQTDLLEVLHRVPVEDRVVLGLDGSLAAQQLDHEVIPVLPGHVPATEDAHPSPAAFSRVSAILAHRRAHQPRAPKRQLGELVLVPRPRSADRLRPGPTGRARRRQRVGHGAEPAFRAPAAGPGLVSRRAVVRQRRRGRSPAVVVAAAAARVVPVRGQRLAPKDAPHRARAGARGARRRDSGGGPGTRRGAASGQETRSRGGPGQVRGPGRCGCCLAKIASEQGACRARIARAARKDAQGPSVGLPFFGDPQS